MPLELAIVWSLSYAVVYFIGIAGGIILARSKREKDK